MYLTPQFKNLKITPRPEPISDISPTLGQLYKSPFQAAG